MASPSAGAPALNYGDVNTVTPSPGEAKGLMKFIYQLRNFKTLRKTFTSNLFVSNIDVINCHNLILFQCKMFLNLFENKQKMPNTFLSMFAFPFL